MFCAHSYAGLFTKQRDNMCFWSTAGTPMTPGQVPPETVCLLSFCYLFAIFLLPVCYLFAICLLSVCYLFAICLLLVCYLFATCLLPLPSAVKRVRHVSDVYIAAPQGFPFRIPFISARWSPQVKSDPLSNKSCHAWRPGQRLTAAQ